MKEGKEVRKSASSWHWEVEIAVVSCGGRVTSQGHGADREDGAGHYSQKCIEVTPHHGRRLLFLQSEVDWDLSRSPGNLAAGGGFRVFA